MMVHTKGFFPEINEVKVRLKHKISAIPDFFKEASLWLKST